MCSRNHFAARQAATSDQLVHVQLDQQRQQQEQPPGVRGEFTLVKRKLPDIRHRVGLRAGPVRPLVVGPAGEPEKPLLPQDLTDCGNTQVVRPRPLQFVPNVVHRVVLLAQGDHPVPDRILSRLRLRAARHGPKEFLVDLTMPEAMTEDAEGAGLVAEEAGRLGAGQPLYVKGAKGLVLALAGMAGFQEESGRGGGGYLL